MQNFLNVLLPITFIVFLLLSAIIGFFQGWKRSLYYGIINLLLYLLFYLIIRFSPETFQNLARKLPYVAAQDKQVVKLFAQELAGFVIYLIAVIVLNIILVLVDLLVLKKFLKKNKKINISKKKRFLKGLAGLFLNVTLFLPIIFTTSTNLVRLTEFSLDTTIVYHKKNGVKKFVESEGVKKAGQKFQFFKPLNNFLNHTWTSLNILGDSRKPDLRNSEKKESQKKSLELILTYLNSKKIAAVAN